METIIATKKIILPLIIISTIVGLLLLNSIGKYTLWRTTTLYDSAINNRLYLWASGLTLWISNPVHVLIGRGTADYLAGGSHNQYIRNLAAVGIIGSLVFYILFMLILKKSSMIFAHNKDPLIVALAAGFFLSTIGLFILFISEEAFRVVRIAETYWYFAGITFAVIYDKRF